MCVCVLVVGAVLHCTLCIGMVVCCSVLFCVVLCCRRRCVCGVTVFTRELATHTFLGSQLEDCSLSCIHTSIYMLYVMLYVNHANCPACCQASQRLAPINAACLPALPMQVLRSAAEWRRWEGMGSDPWREAKRQLWAEELFEAQQRRRVQREQLRCGGTAPLLLFAGCCWSIVVVRWCLVQCGAVRCRGVVMCCVGLGGVNMALV